MYNRGIAGAGHSSSRHRLTRAIATLTSVCAFGLGAGAVTASPASAALLDRCPDRQISTPFAPWGDDNSYYAVADGTFEAGGTDWTLSDATVVDDNESFYVNDASDTQSLSLSDGARAESPSTCVDLGEDTIRFFVKTSGDADSTLHVKASVEDPLTGIVVSTGYDIHGDGTGQWSPTDPIVIPNVLGGLLYTGRLSLVFTTRGTPATWNVDDVYVDPFKSH
jgi:hypothetical protein